MRTLDEEMRLARAKKQQAAIDKQRPEPSAEQSMRLSIWEGGYYGILTGLTQSFLAPLALLFSASNLVISLLSTLPTLVGSLFQLRAPEVLDWFRSRRRYMLVFLGVQAVVWVLIGLLTLIPNTGVALLLLVLLSIAASSFSLLVNPVWMSYIGDLVPVHRRNRFFGVRNAITGAVTFGATIVAGLVLLVFGANPAWGFLILFVGAGAARAASVACFWFSKDLLAPPKEKRFSLQRFLNRIPTSDFGRFVSLAVTLRVAAYVSAPFFVVYQLKVLNLDYFLFTILQLASLVSSFLSVRYWTMVVDNRGNRHVLLYSGFLIAFIPLLWITTAAFPALLLFQLFSGIAWAGFNLASSNYMLEATSSKSRTRPIAYFNLLNNVAIFVGGIAGAFLLWLAGLVIASPAAPFLIVFGVSGVLRLSAASIARPKLRELRYLEIPVRRGLVTSFVTLLPQQGLVVQHYAPVSDYVIERLHHARKMKDEFDEFEKVGVPKHVVKRMKPKERELLRERFIERSGGQLPKRPRGMKK